VWSGGSYGQGQDDRKRCEEIREDYVG